MRTHGPTPIHDFLPARSWQRFPGSLLLLLACLAVVLPQAAMAQCWSCGKKPLRYSLRLQPGTTMKLSCQSVVKELASGALPKEFEGVLKIDPYNDAQVITSGQAGKIVEAEIKLELTGYPADEEREVKAELSACGLNIPPPGWLRVIRHRPWGGSLEPTCSCTSTTTYTRGYYWTNLSGWEDESEADVSGFPTSEEAQAALAALKEGYDTADKRFNGAVYTAGEVNFGYRGTYQKKGVDRTEESILFQIGLHPPRAVFDRYDQSSEVTMPSPDPHCPVHYPKDPPDPLPEPPQDKLTDSIKIRMELPGTGSGGAGCTGGSCSGGGTIGSSGIDIQPSPPPGADEDPQLLPLSWTWDLGADAGGNAVGTLALRSDLSAANPLGLDKFLTSAGREGGMTVTALAGQEGWKIAPVAVDVAALQAKKRCQAFSC